MKKLNQKISGLSVKKLLIINILFLICISQHSFACEKDLTLETEKSIEQLKIDLINFEDSLREQVYDLKKSQIGGRLDSILCMPVCGAANKLIKKYLEELGYKVEQLITYELDDNYVTPDHTFLILKINGELVIVDGAYQQFLRPYAFHLLPKPYPESQILVLKYTKLLAFAEEIEAKGIKTYPLLIEKYGDNMGGSKIFSEWTPSNRIKFLLKPWSISKGTHAKGSTEDDFWENPKISLDDL